MPSDNIKENFRSVNIDEQKSTTISGSMSQNKLLNKLFSTFKETTFSKSNFPADILVLETRSKHPKN